MKKTLFCILLSCPLFISFSQQSPGLSREKVAELYKRLYLSSEIDSFPWKGDVRKCESGTLDTSIYLKAENRINFFRLMNGLGIVKVNRKFNKEAQDAALLTKANNLLTHAPTKDMKCFSTSAYNGCSKSCLGISDFKNFHSTGFITGYIWDIGDDNYFVGHRKWILYTKLKEFGYGATDKTDALLVVDGISYDSMPQPEYIAYPWNGFVPVNLIFPKWSFSIPQDKKVDFINAVIVMTMPDGRVLPVEKLKENKNFLDHTLVWTARGVFSPNEIEYGLNSMAEQGFLEKKIKVVIRNVMVDGKRVNYEYNVVPVKM